MADQSPRTEFGVLTDIEREIEAHEKIAFQVDAALGYMPIEPECGEEEE